MNRFRTAMIAGLPLALAGLCVSPLAAQDTGDADVEARTSADDVPLTKGEKRLAKLLEGRVAGEPVRCIRTLRNQRMTTIDRTAYVYGSGSTIYVQRTRNPDLIDADDVLVTTRFSGTQMCRLDQATTADRVQGFFTGAVFFEDFVPYTRVRSGTAGDS